MQGMLSSILTYFTRNIIFFVLFSISVLMHHMVHLIRILHKINFEKIIFDQKASTVFGSKILAALSFGVYGSFLGWFEQKLNVQCMLLCSNCPPTSLNQF